MLRALDREEKLRDIVHLHSAPTRDDSFADDLRALQAELKAPPDAWGFQRR